MKQLLRKKVITTILFIGFLLYFSVQNFKIQKEDLAAIFRSKEEVTARAEKSMSENLFTKYPLIEGYGFLQNMIGKNEDSNFEIVKDTEGKLHYTYFARKANETLQLAREVKELAGRIEDKDTKLLYLMPPDKYIDGHTEFPKGIPYSMSNKTADNFLKQLEEYKIDTIDLRTDILDSGIAPDKLFFDTDHHWSIETAFWGFTKLVEELNERYDAGLDKKGFYTDIANYHQIFMKDSFLGSMGRKTGKNYAGVDDFTLIYPKFKTSYLHYYNNNQEVSLTGPFEKSLLSANSSKYKGVSYEAENDKYSIYMDGNHPIAHIKNEQNKIGPSILFVKDSFTVPLAAFFSTVCKEIYLVDPRYYEENVTDLINEKKLDYVILSYYPQNLVEEFFEFDKQK